MFDNLRHKLDFDDLLFEKRNRDYGAYQLRKRYNSVVSAGILVASLLISAAVVIPFLMTPHHDRVLAGGPGYFQVNMDKFEPPVEQIFVPPPPPPGEVQKIQEVIKYVPPVVVDSVPLREAAPAITDEILAQKGDETGEKTLSGIGDNILSGQGGGGITDEPFFWVEQMPLFRGGDINKFRQWVQLRTVYPQAAVENKIQGKVFLTFIIETDGSVTNVTVVKGVDPLIDNEAVKAIQASPKWSPGLQRGQPVRVRYSISLFFTP
jgi:periplasmic protein TonB